MGEQGGTGTVRFNIPISLHCRVGGIEYSNFATVECCVCRGGGGVTLLQLALSSRIESCRHDEIKARDQAFRIDRNSTIFRPKVGWRTWKLTEGTQQKQTKWNWNRSAKKEGRKSLTLFRPMPFHRFDLIYLGVGKQREKTWTSIFVIYEIYNEKFLTFENLI